MPDKVINNTALDWGGEGLLVRVVGRFKNWGIPQFDLLPVRLLWWKGGQKKITQQHHYVNEQILSCKVVQGLHLQEMSFPDLNSISIHVSGYTTAVRSAAIYYWQPSHRRTFWRFLKYFLHSMHRVIIFLVVQMNKWRIGVLAGFYW